VGAALKPKNAFQTLDERAIIKTLEVLRSRVAERFPTRGLAKTAAHLVDLARVSARESGVLRERHWGLRAISIGFLAAGIVGFVKLINIYYTLELGGAIRLTEFTQGLDATLNIMLICGLAIGFSASIENRYKRVKALNGLYRLRAISHVVDMHQLTKDPAVIAGTERTTSSPIRDLTPSELIRYLDYCTEMLSLIGKLAALYAQYFPDATVISAVNDIEELTTNLSRKVWQKIVLAQQTERVA
jgi:hypothetical protein